MASLWSPFQIKGLSLKNRVVMAPTVKFCINRPDGSVCDELVEHYRRRARSGTGLIIVEATAPTVGGKLHKNNLGLWGDEQIPGLARIASVIHAEGAQAILQLCYTGVSSKDPDADRVSPSPVYFQGGADIWLGRELTQEEIRAIQLSYRDAARRAWQAGFDGVEIHCTHSKLYGYFFDAVTNRRTDGYGGSFENRARIFTQTLALVRGAVPADFVVGLRVGVNLPDYENARGILKAVDAAHPDYYHFSINMALPDVSVPPPAGFPCSTAIWDGARLRKEVTAPVILSHEIALPSQAEYLLENDLADLVSIGRGMLADWDWTRKAKEGTPVDACRHCTVCQWRTDLHRCPAVFAREQSQP